AFAGVEAQTEPEWGWEDELVCNLNFTQTTFSNWAQGGESTWSWQVDVLARLLNDQVRHGWTNSLRFSYGRTRAGERRARKASDEIRLESVLTFKKDTYVNPYFAISAETQISPGYF